MAGHDEPGLEEHLWTIAAATAGLRRRDEHSGAAQLIGPARFVNLSASGINDWGGVSPVTPDHVNPERPWPQIETLIRETAKAGKVLVERLAIYPAYVRRADDLA